MNNQQLFIKYFICFCMFFILTWLAKRHNSHKLMTNKGWASDLDYLTGLQIAGILWLGLIPVLIMPGHHIVTVIFGNSVPKLLRLVPFVLLSAITGIIAYSQAGQDFLKFSDYDNIVARPKQSYLTSYFIFRIAFLIAYELWFRGFLLRDSVAAFGLVYAVSINTALYVLIHAFSGKKEAAGCIPFGIVLCLLSWWMNAVWPAIILHLTLALVYEIRIVTLFSQKLKTVL